MKLQLKIWQRHILLFLTFVINLKFSTVSGMQKDLILCGRVFMLQPILHLKLFKLGLEFVLHNGQWRELLETWLLRFASLLIPMQICHNEVCSDPKLMQ